MSFSGFARLASLLALAAFATLSGPAYGIVRDPSTTVTFDTLQNGAQAGSIITDQFSSLGVTFAADNYRPGGPDKAILFNSDWSNTPDLDLQFPWSRGNLTGVRLSRMLIVAENVTDADKNGIVDRPDDEFVGGSIFITFDSPKTSLGLDIVDLDREPNAQTIEFLLRGVSLRTISMDQFSTPGAMFYDPTIVWGDRSANRIRPISAGALGLVAFDAVTIRMPDSGAIDNLVFDGSPNVPEPTAAAILLVGAPALLRRRR